MSKSSLVTNNWSGGASVDPKIGGTNAFKKSRSIDNRTRMSSIRLNKRTVKESGAIVDTPVFDGVRAPDRSVFFMGNEKVYRRLPEAAGQSGIYSVFKTGLTNAKSGVYNRDRKKLYIPGNTTVHAINYFDPATPTFQENLISELLDHEKINTGTLAYTLPTSINEGDTHKYSWQPEIEPLTKVSFYVIAKGTGNITATIHDAANNLIATKTLPTASVTAGAVNTIVFDTPIRVQAKPNPQTYHAHLIVSAGTTTVRVETASNLSTADFKTYASALIGDVYHPCGEFLQFIVIGNGNYLAVWEPITDTPNKQEFDPHRLKLPSEYTVLGFAKAGEYYAISAYKSVSSDYGGEFGSNATEGLIGYWDGASKGFAWFVEIEAGAMESIYAYKGLVYGYINGVLHVTSGDIPVPVFTMPGTDEFQSSHNHDDDVYLQAPYKGMCAKDNMLQMAYPMLTVNDNVIPGVYSFGKKTKDFTEGFAQDHIPSHGSEDIEYDGAGMPLSGITYLGRFGKNMFVAWQHGSGGNQTFGIDVIRENNPYYPIGYVDYLDINNKVPYKQKDAIEIIATYEGTLPTGAKIVPRYRIDGESEYQYGDASEIKHDSENKQFKLKVPHKYHNIEYGVELHASTDNTQTPICTSTSIIVENNGSEGL